MSTRAMFTFQDKRIRLHVYKHHDGYPSGAVEAIEKALPLAWPLPRFEADEFGAAFVAGNKPAADPRFHGGGVRLLPHGFPKQVWQKHCSNIEYRYHVTLKQGALHVEAFKVDAIGERLLFSGSFADFAVFARDD